MILTEKMVENDDVFLPGFKKSRFHYYSRIILTGKIVENDDVFFPGLKESRVQTGVREGVTQESIEIDIKGQAPLENQLLLSHTNLLPSP